jgi:glycosyltransferase involved in cell wall biosynthesis
MKAVKAVFLTHYKPCFSGYADYAFHLVNSLADLYSDEILVVLGCRCNPKRDDQYTTVIKKKNVIIKRIFKKNMLTSLIRIIGFLIRVNTEILYIYYPLEFFSGFLLAPLLNIALPLLLLPILKIKKVKLVIDLDNIHKPYEIRGKPKERAFFIAQIVILKLLSFNGAVIVCRNIIAQRLLMSMGFNRRSVRYIPHGIPRISFVASEKIKSIKEILKSETGYVILYWGFISRYKGVDYLIKALKYVVKEFSDVKLVIAGDYFNPLDKYVPEKHRYLPYLRSLVKSLELEDKVIFVTKHLREDEVDSLVASSDIVVLPYVTKNLSASGVLARVMSHGKPVIVTSCGWFAGYVFNGINGLIVPQGDEHALAKATIWLLRDAQLRRLLAENMEKVAENFTWLKVVKKWFKLFEELQRGVLHDAR